MRKKEEEKIEKIRKKMRKNTKKKYKNRICEKNRIKGHKKEFMGKKIFIIKLFI